MVNGKERNKCSVYSCNRIADFIKTPMCEAHYTQLRRNGKITSKIISKHEKHGDYDTAEYRAWAAAWGRCTNRNNKRYGLYGARGIRVCARWEKYSNFLKDMGRRPTTEHSLDRKNNDGNYSAGNCRWATSLEQKRNRRTTKIDQIIARKIRKLKEYGVSSKDIAKKFSISPGHVSDILRGRYWKERT